MAAEAMARGRPAVARRWRAPLALGGLALALLVAAAVGGSDGGPGPQVAAQGAAATQLRVIACQPVADGSGMAVTTALVDFPPGAGSPRHRHPGSVSAYVLDGRVRSQLAGGPARTYGPGQTWFEPPGAIHLFARNLSATRPARLLAVFIAEQDCGPLVIPDPGAAH